MAMRLSGGCQLTARKISPRSSKSECSCTELRTGPSWAYVDESRESEEEESEPEAQAGKEFLTAEEAANLEREAVDRNTDLANRAALRTEVTRSVDRGEDGAPGFYNNFWLDGGTTSTGRTSLIIDPPNGRIPPLTPEAQRVVNARREYLSEHPADSWLDRNTSDRCIVGFNAGPPITPLGYNQNLQVFQTPDHVVLVTEMVHTSRVVPLDGRPSLSDDIRQWSGDSRGHWEGDTLVVETANFDVAVDAPAGALTVGHTRSSRPR